MERSPVVATRSLLRVACRVGSRFRSFVDEVELRFAAGPNCFGRGEAPHSASGPETISKLTSRCGSAVLVLVLDEERCSWCSLSIAGF